MSLPTQTEVPTLQTAPEGDDEGEGDGAPLEDEDDEEPDEADGSGAEPTPWSEEPEPHAIAATPRALHERNRRRENVRVPMDGLVPAQEILRVLNIRLETDLRRQRRDYSEIRA